MSVLHVAVPAYAKLNLCLRVLGKRADNFHELRTVFQTISLHDTIGIEFRKARVRAITCECLVDIPDNIAVRAAALMLDEMHVNAHMHIRIDKRIPMGGGLGGGSTNAAAVLLALPHLARKRVDPARLLQLAASLGSDVPFFLRGGTALGLSRGEELYPFPEPAVSHAVLVTPGIHVSTPEAYRALGRGPEVVSPEPMPTASWDIAQGASAAAWSRFCQNDFESTVFTRHPELATIQRKLLRLGAGVARMSGSGSTVFGFFATQAAAREACAAFPSARVVRTVTREQYQEAWRKSLSAISESG
ncbi:MAG: 4-(cytidine 5'-diphospho)-2-C-methyl-D-erythritol kinase [Acidobacteria bacterium]|nr:4-(cytidine 5'-diphospho)-2-C-methyl-D-erythritol kinase [Acidobacteriota bacterium]